MRGMTLIVLIALSAAPVLKIGDVQAVEILQTLWLALAAPAFLYRGMRVPYSWRGYALFLGLCLALSAVAPFRDPPR